MSLRRKHWLLASLSCTSILLVLAFRPWGPVGQQILMPSFLELSSQPPARPPSQPFQVKSNQLSGKSQTSKSSINNSEYSPPFRISNDGSVNEKQVNSNRNQPNDEYVNDRRENKNDLLRQKESNLNSLSNRHLNESTGLGPKRQDPLSDSLKNLVITDIDAPAKEVDTWSDSKAGTSKNSGDRRNSASRKTKLNITGKGSRYISSNEALIRSYPQIVNAGVNAARYRVSREYLRFPGDVSFKPGFPVPKDQVKRVLILTTWRSGSTFLGDIFNAYPGTFYSFEPLHDVLHKKHFEDGPEKSEVINLMKSILNCNMKADDRRYFDYVRNNTFLFGHNTRYWQACSINRALCYDPDFFNKVCEVMPVNVMKTVRLGAQPVEDLLEDDSLDLRVIHLVRDPRGTMHSRQKLNWCKLPVCSDPEVVCDNLHTDLVHSERLQAMYPERFLLVRYEDLGTRPESMVKLILNFVGLTVTDSVKHFVTEHTQLVTKNSKKLIRGKPRRKKPTNAYSTFRDSKSTTFAWRKRLNFTTVNRIQNSCAKPIKLLNLRTFSDESEYINNNLSVLLPD